MSEEKFTKGVWELAIHGDEEDPFYDVALGAAQNGQIIILDIEGHTDEEAKANAYLIAAAPELFRACEKALKLRSLENSILTSEKLSVTERNELRREASEIEDELRAVLAKVEGEK
jgi:hypothetical protein